MKQKYSEQHHPQNATQPSTNLSSFATTSVSNSSSSPAEQQQSNLASTQTDSKTGSKKNGSSTHKNKTNTKTNTGNQIAGGISKSSSFSLLYNRNANKHKPVVQRQQSENVPSPYFVQQAAVYQEQSAIQHQNVIKKQQPQAFSQNVATRNRMIKHSTSMDSFESPYQLKFTCPKHGIYQFIDQQPQDQHRMVENVEPNLVYSSAPKKLKATFSLHSMQNLQEEDTFVENHEPHCSLHQSYSESVHDKSSQTDETNLNEECGPTNLNQPYLKHHLPTAQSLPSSYLPPTLLKASSSFPSPQSSTCHPYHAYLHYQHQASEHAVAPFEEKIDQNSTSFYNFISSQPPLQYSQSSKISKFKCPKAVHQCNLASNQVNLEQKSTELNLQQLNDHYTTANSGENYYELEQPSLTSESVSTGGIMNAMAEVLDDEESASRFDLKMFSNSLEEFDDRLNVTAAGYSLGEDEILKEEDYLEQEAENDVDLQMYDLNEANEKIVGEQRPTYFVPFKSGNSIPNCQNRFGSGRSNLISALKREEDTLQHETNINEALDYNLKSSQPLDDIQKEDEFKLKSDHADGDLKRRREIDNLSELTIKKSKEDKKISTKQSNLNQSDLETNRTRDASIETKKRLRDSTSTTDSSLINDRKIRKQDTRSVNKRKRNWFFRQISNSSKSYGTSSSTNCDTCSIITNQDTMEDDNVFDEKFNNETSASGRRNQTRNKFAQLHSQIKQQTSFESDQSALTTTTISLTGASSNHLSRQTSQSSFGLKNLFRKKKRRRLSQERMNGQNDDGKGQRRPKTTENLNSQNFNQINDNDRTVTQLPKQHEQFRKDKHHIKSKHIKTVKTTDKRHIGGIKSRPLKQIVHPLERSITGFFVITLFFTMLAIISGVPIVCLLCLFLPFAVGIRNLITCDFRTSYSVNEHKCTPSEHYWLNSTWKNNCKKGQACVLFMIDPGFTLEQCRDLIQSRLIQKVGTERFRWILRYKGWCFYLIN